MLYTVCYDADTVIGLPRSCI